MNCGCQLPKSGSFTTLDRIRRRRTKLERDLDDKDALNEIDVQRKRAKSQDIAGCQRFVIFDLCVIEENWITRPEIANVVIVIGVRYPGVQPRHGGVIEKQFTGRQTSHQQPLGNDVCRIELQIFPNDDESCFHPNENLRSQISNLKSQISDLRSQISN